MESITARLDAATLIPLELRMTELPPPKSGKLALTGRCNLHCAYCSRTISDSGGDMDRDLFSSIIREMHDLGIRSTGLFFIGESMLCRDLPERIAECKEVGFDYVFLTTNATLALEGKVEDCMRAGLDSLKFSLNYADRDQFADIARVSPALFDRMLENIRSARRIRDEGGYGTRLYASSILYDGEQRDRMQALVDTMLPYLDEFYWLPCFSMGGAAGNAGFKPQIGNPGRIGALRDPLPCWSLWNFHINPNGDMISCCFGDGGDDRHIMGNVRELGFMGAWNSPKFQALRAAHLAGDVTGTPCETCALGA